MSLHRVILASTALMALSVCVHAVELGSPACAEAL